MPAVVNQELNAAALSTQHRFRAYASPMHVGVQFSPSEKAGLEDQREAYPDICFALDGAEALCPTVSPLWPQAANVWNMRSDSRSHTSHRLELGPCAPLWARSELRP